MNFTDEYRYMSMKNKDSGFFVIQCLMLLMLVTSWPCFKSSNFSSSRSTEWCVAPHEMVFLARAGMCGSWHLGFLATLLIFYRRLAWSCLE